MSRIVTQLIECECKHCQQLGQYLSDPRMGIEELGYEDVFTPLRCHHDSGVTLVVSSRDGLDAGYQWGRGDFIYRADDDVRTYETAVDPFHVFRRLGDPGVTIGLMA